MAQDAPLTVQQDAEGCFVATPPGNASGVAVTFGAAIEGTIWLRASGADWPFQPGRIYRIRAYPSAEASPPDGPGLEARGFRDAAGWGGFSASVGLRELNRGSDLALYLGSDAMPFARIPNPFPNYAAELRRCRNAIVEGDHGSGRLGVSPPVLRGGYDSYVTDDDYPIAAIRAEQGGTTRIRLAVSAHGMAASCEVTASSGSALLDRTGCGIFQRRGRFLPARDDAGQATEGTFALTIKWEINENREVHITVSQ